MYHGRCIMLKVLALVLTSQLPQPLWAYKGIWMGNVGSVADGASHLSSIFVHSLPHGLRGSLIGPRWVILFSGDKFRNADQSHPLPGHSYPFRRGYKTHVHEWNSRRGILLFRTSSKSSISPLKWYKDRTQGRSQETCLHTTALLIFYCVSLRFCSLSKPTFSNVK